MSVRHRTRSAAAIVAAPLVRASLLLLQVLVLSACDGPARARRAPSIRSDVPPPPPAPSRGGDFATGVLAHHAATVRAGENVLLSPTSLALALRLVTEGAVDDARDSLVTMLGFAGQGDAAMGDSSRARIAALRGQRDVRLAIGTALWADSGVALAPAFLERARRSYDATAEVVDLQSGAGVARVDAWASRATEGRVRGILHRPQPPAVALVVTNAVYFKGRWADAFDASLTDADTFDGPSGGTPVSMMRRTGMYNLHESDGVRVARLPYRGNRFAMYVLLPDSTHDIGDAVRALAPGLLRDAAAAPPRELALELPRLTLHASASLEPALRAMGAGIAFTPGARLSRLFAVAPESSFISRVQQDVFMEVNEEGTEAAAVTAITIDAGTSMPRPLPFRVDRPFVFAIRDDRTGEVLFTGRVMDPRTRD